jgi:hypothetical protein
MPATTLIKLLEDQADALTNEAVQQLIMHPRTPSCRVVPRDHLGQRVQALFRNAAAWAGKRDDDAVRAAYEDWGRTRFAQKVPISELVYVVILCKDLLRRTAKDRASIEPGEVDALTGEFFDRALYYLVRGYEMQAATPPR